MAPPRDINEIRQRIAAADHPDPWGVSDAEAIAAYNRAATPNEQYGSGDGGGGYGGGPSVVGGIDWFNSIDASSYRKAMQELARQQFELDKARQEFIDMPNAENERKRRDAQTAYDQGRLALDQARFGLEQTKYGTDTQMDIWKEQVRMAEQRAAGTGVYFAPSGNPTMPPAYQDLTKVTMETPMAPEQEGAQLAAVRAQVNAATRAKTGRDMSEAEWRTWLTGRVDPELAQQMMAADARAGRQSSDRTGKNVFDLGWFNGAEHTALYSQLPDRYQRQIEQTTGWAITPQGPAKAGSTTTLSGATLSAPAQPRTFQPAYGGGSPQPGAGVPDTGMRPVGSGLSVGNTAEPQYMERNFGMNPSVGNTAEPGGGRVTTQTSPGNWLGPTAGQQTEPGRYGAQQPPNWQAQVAAGSNSQPGGYGNPNPYAGQLDYVYDPRTGQWGERQIGDRAQSLSEWEALQRKQHNDAMMRANPANYALVQAMQGGSPWQQPQGQQPGNWQEQVAAGSSGGQKSLAAQSGREFSLGQYGQLRPDQRAAFGSAIKAGGRTEDDWLDEAKRYAPNQQTGGASQGRWR